MTWQDTQPAASVDAHLTLFRPRVPAAEPAAAQRFLKAKSGSSVRRPPVPRQDGRPAARSPFSLAFGGRAAPSRSRGHLNGRSPDAGLV